MDPHLEFADIASFDRFNAHAYRSAGHKLIAIKATEGDQYVNPFHAAWAHAAHVAGLAVLHYHFCHPENRNPIAEATHFWQTAHPHFLPGDRLAFDLEVGNPADSPGWLHQADRQVLNLNGGKDRPIGYTYLSYFEQAPLRLTSQAWWIAAWGLPMRLREGLGGRQYLWAHQHTDGSVGQEPRHFAGVIGSSPGGNCDGSTINSRSLALIDKERQHAR